MITFVKNYFSSFYTYVWGWVNYLFGWNNIQTVQANKTMISDIIDVPKTTLTKEVSTTDIQIEVVNAANIAVNSYLDINGEEMLVESIDNNKLKVKRGQDGTQIQVHVSGSNVKRITAQDDALIPYGDDFGFDSVIN